MDEAAQGAEPDTGERPLIRPEWCIDPGFTGGTDWGMILAADGDGVLHAPPYHPIGVFGSPRSHKSESLVVGIAAWHGPVVALSVRADHVGLTARARARRGTVALYDPSGTVQADVDRCGWDPLEQCDTVVGAVSTTRWLARAASATGIMDAAFWYALAGQGLWPHLYLAAVNGYSMRSSPAVWCRSTSPA